MGNQYTPVSITGYNSNPPVDDGTQTEANRVKWSTIKTKLNDPVKTRTDEIDTNVAAAFAKIDGGVTSTSISYTVLSTDQGKLVRATSSGVTITTPDATDVDAPFVFSVLNDSEGDITIDGSGAQTIDGDATVTLPGGAGVRVRTDGTNWMTEGQNFQRPLATPQCYLTVLDATTFPTQVVPSSDQSAKTAVYARPFGGNLMPISNGTLFSVREFAELTLTLHANHVASGIYDVFVFDNSGTITVGTGPVWTTVTAGSCARGTGAGTTQLSLLKGLLVNTVAMTARNGATTYSVAASCGTFLGSIFIDGTAGQVSCHVSAGQSRKWGISNAYNEQDIAVKMTDATASWSNAPTSWRQSRADSTNFIHIFSCLPNRRFNISFSQTIKQQINSTDDLADIGIGYNSTTTVSGRQGRVSFSSAVAGIQYHIDSPVALYDAPPAIGINKINAIEQAGSGTADNTFFGTEALMCMTAKWRG